MSTAICNDRVVKYMLLHMANVASKGVVLPRVYAKSRTRFFDSMYRIQVSATKASVKPQHLYVIPYSRYYTLRQILCDNNEEQDVDEDDEAIKLSFKSLMEKPFSSKQAMESAFFEVIKRLKTTDELYVKYDDLDKKLLKSQWNEDELIQFVECTSEIDTLISKKLSEDVELYATRKEKLLTWLKDHRFLNGWITAAGVALLSLI